MTELKVGDWVRPSTSSPLIPFLLGQVTALVKGSYRVSWYNIPHGPPDREAFVYHEAYLERLEPGQAALLLLGEP